MSAETDNVTIGKASESYSGDDRATRLAAVILAWNVFQHFYPYFDVVKVDWLTVLKSSLEAAATDLDRSGFLKTLQRLVAKLEDGHGRVYDLNQKTVSRFTLPFTWDWVEESLVITHVLPESNLDLQPGDIVLKIDGEPAAKAKCDRQQCISSATPQWKQYRVLQSLLWGEEYSMVELEVKSVTGKLNKVTAHRHVLVSDESTFSLPLFWQWREEQLVVTYVTAACEVIEQDEIILSLNGKPVAEAIAKTQKQLSEQLPEWFNTMSEQFRKNEAIQELRTGARNSKVLLLVRSPSGESRTVELARTLQVWNQKEPRPPKIHQLQPGIIYTDFDRVSDLELQQALPLFEEAKGIIIDLRGYPRNVSVNPIGHLIDKPVNSAQWHIPIVNYPDRQEFSFDFSNWSIKPRTPKLKAKIVFITDGRAISYAETYMAIIEHYQLAEIVGQPTAGTNGNVNYFDLPGGYRVVWTGMKVLKHDGSQHHGVGILPTVPVERTIQGITQGRDEFLAKAIEVVSLDPDSSY